MKTLLFVFCLLAPASCLLLPSAPAQNRRGALLNSGAALRPTDAEVMALPNLALWLASGPTNVFNRQAIYNRHYDGAVLNTGGVVEEGYHTALDVTNGSATLFGWVKVLSTPAPSADPDPPFLGTPGLEFLWGRWDCYPGSDAQDLLEISIGLVMDRSAGHTNLGGFLYTDPFTIMQAGSATTLDAWHFFAIRYNATNKACSFRVDAANSTPYTASTRLPPTHWDYQRMQLLVKSPAQLAQTGLSRHVLSDAELTALYNSGAGLPYESISGAVQAKLAGYWSFAHGAANVAAWPAEAGAVTLTPGFIPPAAAGYFGDTNIHNTEYASVVDGPIATVATNAEAVFTLIAQNSGSLIATQAVLASRPVWTNGVLDFTNSQTLTLGTSITATTNMSIFALLLARAPAGSDFRPLLVPSDSSKIALGVCAGRLLATADSDPFGVGYPGAILSADARLVAEWSWNGSAIWTSVNGGTPVTNSPAAPPAPLGTFTTLGDLTGGQVQHLIILTNSTAAQRGTVRTYLIDRL